MIDTVLAGSAAKEGRAPCRRWLPLVLLLVLFAAGVPATVGTALAEQRLELAGEGTAREPVCWPAALTATGAHSLRARAHGGRRELSWRGLTVHGLPPARAPTA